MGQLDKKKQVERETARAQKVQDITDRLIAQAIKFRPEAASSGMWEQLKATDDEIAQVMGHEISHALADHTRERMSIARSTSLGVQLAAVVAARAGYDPKSAVTLWEKMGKLAGSRQAEFLSTHPSPEHRAEKLKEFGAKVEPHFVAAKANPIPPHRYASLGPSR